MSDTDYIENEDRIDLREYWHILYRRKWIFIAVFFLIFSTMVVRAVFMKPIYRATTTLLIEPDIPHLANLAETAPSRISEDYQRTQYEIIKSYTVAKKAYDSLKRSGKLENIEKTDKDPVLVFKEKIEVEPVKDSRLVRISIEGKDPRKTADRVNELAKAYIMHNLEDRRAGSKDAFAWLSEQISVMKASVRKSEMDLLKFKEQEDIVSLEKRQILVEEKLFSLQESYTQATNRRTELEIMLEEIKKLEENPDMAESLPRILENPLIQSLKADLSRLETDMARLSIKFKPKHPKIASLRSQINNIRKRLNGEVGKIAKSVSIEYRLARAKEDAIEKDLDTQKRESMKLAQQAINYGVLRREAESNRKMYDVLLNRLKETDIDGSITANNIRVVDKAKMPEKPVKPQKKKVAATAMLLGLIFGTLACFVVEWFDRSIKTEEDVTLHLNDSLLGLVPEAEFSANGTLKISGRCARAYRDIKTILSIYGQEHALKTVLVTSSLESEGKTTSTIAIGSMFARAGRKVLLMDLDLMKPQMGKSFHIENKPGISNYVTDRIGLKNIIHESVIPNLWVMPAGVKPPNPTGLMSSDIIKGLIDRVKPVFDIILIDSMPVGAAFEVAVIGGAVDGVAFVVKANDTSRVVARNVLDKLKASKCNMLGVILCQADINSSTDTYYNYYGKKYEEAA